MICSECKIIAKTNRARFEYWVNEANKPDNLETELIAHPDCGCACGHEMPEQWEKMYRLPKPEFN